MIAHAYQKGHLIILYTTTLGMKERDLKILENVELLGLTVHIPDEQGNSKINMSGNYFDIMIKFWKKHVKPNLPYSCHGDVHPQFKQEMLKAGINIDDWQNITETVYDFAGNVEIDESKLGKNAVLRQSISDFSNKPIICSRYLDKYIMNNDDFYLSTKSIIPVMLPNCEAYVCCKDMGQEHSLGNMLKLKSVYDLIKNNKQYEYFQNAFLNPEMPIICRRCDSILPVNSITVCSIDKNAQN